METPPTSPTDSTAMLLAFLRDHDAPCPVCGYNLRHLTLPRCPECGRELKLSVGAVEPFMAAWIVLTIATFASSGIAILLDSYATYQTYKTGRPLPFRGLEILAWWSFTGSIPFALGALVFRRRIMRMNRGLQWLLAIIATLITVAQIALFVGGIR